MKPLRSSAIDDRQFTWDLIQADSQVDLHRKWMQDIFNGTAAKKMHRYPCWVVVHAINHALTQSGAVPRTICELAIIAAATNKETWDGTRRDRTTFMASILNTALAVKGPAFVRDVLRGPLIGKKGTYPLFRFHMTALQELIPQLEPYQAQSSFGREMAKDLSDFIENLLKLHTVRERALAKKKGRKELAVTERRPVKYQRQRIPLGDMDV